MNARYFVTGLLLTLILVSGVFWARKSFSTDAPGAAEETGAMTKGPADAPVHIVEYTNFQCPACARSQEVLKGLLEKYPGKIRLVFRHYPFLSESWSLRAHQAAECAARQNRFWEYHDLLFGNQAAMMNIPDPTQNFFIYARDAKLDLDAFGACILSAEVTQKVMKDRGAGQKVQVSATPTFFINDTRLVGWTALRDEAEAKIREILGLPALPKPEVPVAQALAPLQPPPPAQVTPRLSTGITTPPLAQPEKQSAGASVSPSPSSSPQPVPRLSEGITTQPVGEPKKQEAGSSAFQSPPQPKEPVS